MKFLVIEEQPGGCDYTIGCGLRVSEMEAETIDAAVGEIMRDSLQDDPEEWNVLDTHEGKRSKVTVYEIGASQELPLNAWRIAKQMDQERERSIAAERSEREQLERLRAKYG